MSKKNLIEKETPHGIKYPAWSEQMLKKFPITDQHVGVPIKTAFNPRSKDHVLVRIKKEGEDRFPNGGYVITDPDSAFNKPIFLEEAVSFPPKKKRGRKPRKKKTK